MKLPNCTKVVIPKEKLTGYLLSVTHPEGKSKARLFRSLGFDETNIDKFIKALRKIAKSRKVVSSRPSVDNSGINYVVLGKIATPIGGIRNIKTVWFIRKNQRKPRFVTAFPLK